jgi:hypothetical protein
MKNGLEDESLSEMQGTDNHKMLLPSHTALIQEGKSIERGHAIIDT